MKEMRVVADHRVVDETAEYLPMFLAEGRDAPALPPAEGIA